MTSVAQRNAKQRQAGLDRSIAKDLQTLVPQSRGWSKWQQMEPGTFVSSNSMNSDPMDDIDDEELVYLRLKPSGNTVSGVVDYTEGVYDDGDTLGKFKYDLTGNSFDDAFAISTKANDLLRKARVASKQKRQAGMEVSSLQDGAQKFLIRVGNEVAKLHDAKHGIGWGTGGPTGNNIDTEIWSMSGYSWIVLELDPKAGDSYEIEIHWGTKEHNRLDSAKQKFGWDLDYKATAKYVFAAMEKGHSFP